MESATTASATRQVEGVPPLRAIGCKWGCETRSTPADSPRRRHPRRLVLLAADLLRLHRAPPGNCRRARRAEPQPLQLLGLARPQLLQRAVQALRPVATIANASTMRRRSQDAAKHLESVAKAVPHLALRSHSVAMPRLCVHPCPWRYILASRSMAFESPCRDAFGRWARWAHAHVLLTLTGVLHKPMGSSSPRGPRGTTAAP